MVKTTPQQRKALWRVFTRVVGDYNYEQGMTQHVVRLMAPDITGYRKFRRLVQPGPGCIMIPYAGMWLGIEPDGYTHS